MRDALGSERKTLCFIACGKSQPVLTKPHAKSRETLGRQNLWPVLNTTQEIMGTKAHAANSCLSLSENIIELSISEAYVKGSGKKITPKKACVVPRCNCWFFMSKLWFSPC